MCDKCLLISYMCAYTYIYISNKGRTTPLKYIFLRGQSSAKGFTPVSELRKLLWLLWDYCDSGFKPLSAVCKAHYLLYQGSSNCSLWSTFGSPRTFIHPARCFFSSCLSCLAVNWPQSRSTHVWDGYRTLKLPSYFLSFDFSLFQAGILNLWLVSLYCS